MDFPAHSHGLMIDINATVCRLLKLLVTKQTPKRDIILAIGFYIHTVEPPPRAMARHRNP